MFGGLEHSLAPGNYHASTEHAFSLELFACLGEVISIIKTNPQIITNIMAVHKSSDIKRSHLIQELIKNNHDFTSFKSYNQYDSQ